MSAPKNEERNKTVDLSLPAEWQVIGPIEKDHQLSPEMLKQVPGSLVAFGKKCAPQKVKVENGRLDLGTILPVIGGIVLVYIPFTSDRRQTVIFGFGADWLFDAYLDGGRVLDTLAEGNRYHPPSVADHVKIVDLAEGNHLLVIHFTRGGGSAVLCAACSNDMDALHVAIARKHSTRAILSLTTWQSRASLRELLMGSGLEY